MNLRHHMYHKNGEERMRYSAFKFVVMLICASLIAWIAIIVLTPLIGQQP